MTTKNYSSNADIAAELNRRAASRRAYVVSRKRGVGDGHNLDTNADLFPGERLLPARRLDGQKWTAPLVAAELADNDRDRTLALIEHIREIQDGLGDAVDDARQAGASWQQIGDALGVSKQAAQQRFA